MTLKALLTDIIGTASPISFFRTLTEDFEKHGVDYLKRAEPNYRKLVDRIKDEEGLSSREEVIPFVSQQLAERNTRPDYMALSGLVNVEGYKSSRLRVNSLTMFQLPWQNGKKRARASTSSAMELRRHRSGCSRLQDKDRLMDW
jgi:methionine salvage enolase-phosphatase E1